MRLVTMKTMYPQTKADRLVRLAKRNERSLAAEMRIALDNHLGAAEPPKRARL